jgi:hypothetical protein
MSILSAGDTPHADDYEDFCTAAFAMASIAVDSEVIRRTAATLARLGTVLDHPEPRLANCIDFYSALESAA